MIGKRLGGTKTMRLFCKDSPRLRAGLALITTA